MGFSERKVIIDKIYDLLNELEILLDLLLDDFTVSINNTDPNFRNRIRDLEDKSKRVQDVVSSFDEVQNNFSLIEI